MANNFIQDGKHITLTAPYQRNTGLGAQVGSIFGVALQTVANGVAGEFATEGVWYLAKLSTDEWAQGDKVYWDNTNKRCDTDPTVGMLIGVATAAAANPSASGYVRLNGVAPSTSEGPQAAEADLVDSSGGASANGTIGVVTAPTALTDNGGGTADGTVASMTAVTALTVTDGAGTNDGTIGAITGDASVIAAVQEIAAKIVTIAAFEVAAKDNFKELTTAQAANRTAIVALTDAITELATKQNALLAKLRIAGIISA